MLAIGDREISMSVGAMLVIGCLAIAAQAPAASAPDAKVTSCGTTITSCGCTITKSGFYEVTANLTSAQGLTGNNGCIDIKASNVVLTTGQCTDGGSCKGFGLTGSGGMSPTGIGLHILRSSKNDFIELPASVTGWDVGILVEGSDNIVENFGAKNNGTAGVELNGAQNNNISHFDAGFGSGTGNNNYGVWLRHSSNNQINADDVENNGNIGLYVGCSADGPVGSAGCKGVGPSTHNKIFDSSYQSNTNYGIVIDSGNKDNIVTSTNDASNGTDDVFDGNADCGGDEWFFNVYSTSNQGSGGCIQ
jgi:hypothetical protein